MVLSEVRASSLLVPDRPFREYVPPIGSLIF
jgi:hypothetical protein